MYPAPFEYFRAGSVADAQKLWKKHPKAKLLAGGHSLIPLLKLRLAAPPALIDIGRIRALKGITSAKGTIRIGALTTHAELAASALLRSRAAMLADAAAQIGDAQVRNCGTIGGNVAHADPASDLPTVLVALDARFTAAGPKRTRTIAASDFFQGILTTALDAHEILTAVSFAAGTAGEGTAYDKFSHPASRYAVVGAAVWVAAKNGVCTAARVAIGGVTPAAIRVPDVERALVGQRPTPAVIAKAAGLAPGGVGDEALGDVFASADYRRAMTAVYVKRALTTAFARAGK
jgi:carbon-monoxide dehydrogenase medium subunit